MLKKIGKFAYFATVAGLLSYSGANIAKNVFGRPYFCIPPKIRDAVVDDIKSKATSAAHIDSSEKIVFNHDKLLVAFAPQKLQIIVDNFGANFDFYENKKFAGKEYIITRFTHHDKITVAGKMVACDTLEFIFDSKQTRLDDLNCDGLVDIISKTQNGSTAATQSATQSIYRTDQKYADNFKTADRVFSDLRIGLYSADFLELWKKFYDKKD